LAILNVLWYTFKVMNTILKLKKANLLGRGGAGFPTWLKWKLVKKAKAEKKFVICNAAEGEPGVYFEL